MRNEDIIHYTSSIIHLLLHHPSSIKHHPSYTHLPSSISHLKGDQGSPLISWYEKEEVIKNFDHLNKLKFSKVAPTAFTERGLYMLATILKGERAEKTTLAIIDTFVQVRELARTMEALQNVEDGGAQQRTLLQRTGDLLAEVVGHNLSTRTTETEIELNFAVVKIKHKVIRKDETGKE